MTIIRSAVDVKSTDCKTDVDVLLDRRQQNTLPDRSWYVRRESNPLGHTPVFFIAQCNESNQHFLPSFLSSLVDFTTTTVLQNYVRAVSTPGYERPK